MLELEDKYEHNRRHTAVSEQRALLESFFCLGGAPQEEAQAEEKVLRSKGAKFIPTQLLRIRLYGVRGPLYLVSSVGA